MNLWYLRPPVAALAIAAAACGEGPQAAAPPPAAAEFVKLDQAAQQHAGVRVGPVATASRADQTEAPGLIALDERRTARIGSLVEGIVLETFAEVGDRVRQGQLLAAMHSTVVHESWAGYRKARAERRRLEKELAFAIDAHERHDACMPTRRCRCQDLQRAEANRVSAEETLDMGRTELRRSEEELEHLGITNGEDPSGEAGEQIPVRRRSPAWCSSAWSRQGTAVTPGTPLFVVSDLSTLWVLAEIDEALPRPCAVGRPWQRARRRIPGRDVRRHGDLVGETVNPKTRRVTVRCETAEHRRRG